MKKIAGLKAMMLTTLVAVLALTGCNKNENPVVPTEPETIFDLKINSGFDWKTTKALTLNVTGLPVPETVKNTLFVRSEDGKAVYYNNQHPMNQSFSVDVAVPAYQKKLVISYGTISKTMDITGNTLEFNYIVE